MFKDLYKKKKAIVTGHTGFKGSWLAIWLKELGADVVGYSLAPPSEPNNFEATKLQEKITHIHGDIRDLDRLIETFKKYQPEFVFHLAAQLLIRLSYDEPKMTFDTNVGGTVNVFEAIRKTPRVKVLVNITSDKCYENKGATGKMTRWAVMTPTALPRVARNSFSALIWNRSSLRTPRKTGPSAPPPPGRATSSAAATGARTVSFPIASAP
jgi:nucleoside-diphosphate-sugar epimerase